MEELKRVALLAEGVDRNRKRKWSKTGGWMVALLAEGVDRNGLCGGDVNSGLWSPSSRRAWIEIVMNFIGSLYNTGRPPRGGRG